MAVIFLAIVTCNFKSFDLYVCVRACSGEYGTEQLFRVKDWELRARVALQGLEQWPLDRCLELLQFCLSDSSPDHTLTPQLRQKKHELDMYDRVCLAHTTLTGTKCDSYLLFGSALCIEQRRWITV